MKSRNWIEEEKGSSKKARKDAVDVKGLIMFKEEKLKGSRKDNYIKGLNNLKDECIKVIMEAERWNMCGKEKIGLYKMKAQKGEVEPGENLVYSENSLDDMLDSNNSDLAMMYIINKNANLELKNELEINEFVGNVLSEVHGKLFKID